jgi:hypothetical protein
MLDIDSGTYPFVTSSNTGPNGTRPAPGSRRAGSSASIGIAKAYCTRVGEGPFPTEQDNAIGDAIREQGNEYGSTTGRPRRCGWFDAVAVRYALEISGADGWIVTNLDVLTGFDEIRARSVPLERQRARDWPAHASTVERYEPVYASSRLERGHHARAALRGPAARGARVRRVARARGRRADRDALRRSRARAGDRARPLSLAVTRKKEPSAPCGRPVPAHIAIIMDGNGRWAQERGLRASSATARASAPCARSRPSARAWA